MKPLPLFIFPRDEVDVYHYALAHLQMIKNRQEESYTWGLATTAEDSLADYRSCTKQALCDLIGQVPLPASDVGDSGDIQGHESTHR